MKLFFRLGKNKDMGMTKNLFVSLCMYLNGLKIRRDVWGLGRWSKVLGGCEPNIDGGLVVH